MISRLSTNRSLIVNSKANICNHNSGQTILLDLKKTILLDVKG